MQHDKARGAQAPRVFRRWRAQLAYLGVPVLSVGLVTTSGRSPFWPNCGFTLRPMTVNIHKGFTSFNRKFILPELRDAVRKVGADVVFMQEVLGTHEDHGKKIEDWPEAPHYEFLADSIWPQFAYGKNMVYPKGHHGNAIMSKFPIVEVPQPRRVDAGPEKRGLLHCQLQVPGHEQQVHVICVHLGLAEATASSSWSCCARSATPRCPRDAPLIVAGDFNDWRRRANDMLLKEAGLREVFVTAYGERPRPSRDLPAAVAGPHLRAQLLGAPAGGAAAPALVAPVGPRAAGPPRSICEAHDGQRWIPGNQFTLLENGEEFFPRVFACIANARREVIVETFILFEDKVGLQLHEALIAAAKRGAQVDITDRRLGLARPLRTRSSRELREAGVRVHVFNPGRALRLAPAPAAPHAPQDRGDRRRSGLRRRHQLFGRPPGRLRPRGQAGLVGGDPRPAGRRDPPLLPRRPGRGPAPPARQRQWWRGRRRWRGARALPAAGTADAMFVVRDNRQHMDDIERHYRMGIRSAKKRIVIANAYFFPGYRFIRDLRRAARRGVDVRLILQGEPDMPMGAHGLQHAVPPPAAAGVRIYEYCDRPLHGKVALMDDEWSTVGSSNLDPLSLALNLEANVIIRDRAFNQSCRAPRQADVRKLQPDREAASASSRAGLVRSFLAYHFARRYPRWASWLPRHVPRC
jgi:cardiolipin synthase